MSFGCACEVGLSNTGTPGCVTLQGVTSRLVFVPLKDSTGALNFVDVSTSLPTWSTLINQADPTKRWFPTPFIEKPELPKADPVFEEGASGKSYFVKNGKRSFSGEIFEMPANYAGKLQANKCVDFGVYIIDVQGNLVGSLSSDSTKLYPVPCEKVSLVATYMMATDTTVPKIALKFDFQRLFDDSTLWLITPEEAGINFNDLEGLLDVDMKTTAITSTSVSLQANLQYGTAVNKIPVQGLVAADFALFDNTANASVTIATATESATTKGLYNITYTAITGSTHNLTLTVVKTGFTGLLNYVDA